MTRAWFEAEQRRLADERRYAEELKVRAATAERCPTPRCIEIVERHGPAYIRTEPVRFPRDGEEEADLQCSQCGGVRINGEWRHWCRKCGTVVEPGALVGLFVPSQCTTCHTARVAEERARGNVCGRCNQAYALCCC